MQNPISPSQNESERDRFTLPASMTVETAEALANDLQQLPMTAKTHLMLDASQVENITTPGVQLVVALEKTLAASGATLVIEGGREIFTRAFRDAGLESYLSKPS